MRNERILLIIAPVLTLGLLFFGCRQREEAPPEPPKAVLPDGTVVATVSGDPITLGDFRERLARSGIKFNGDADLAVKEEFLNRLVERKMLLREAQRRRLKVGLPEITQRIEALRGEHGKDVKDELAAQGVDYEKWKADIWENLMIEKLVNREVARNIPVSAAEIRRYYAANPDAFTRPEQVRVRQIVLASEAEAQAALEQLRAGGDFAALARERSTAPEAAQGGDLGYFAEGEMPAEFNMVFGLQKGGISDVVKSPYGFHIFRLEDRRGAGKRSLDEVSEEIGRRLSGEKRDERYRRWLKELRSRTKFEVNYPALAQ